MDGEPGAGDDGVESPEGKVRPVTIVLLIVAFLAIPLGMVLVYLAATRGEPTPRAAAGRGVLGLDLDVHPDDLAGQWSLLAGGGSYMGYELVADTADPAVLRGRSATIEASFKIGAGNMEVMVAQADLRALRSEDPARDQALRDGGFETAQHPLALIRFETPTALPATIPPDEPFTITLTGELALHGTRQPVTMAMTVHVLREDQLVVSLDGSASVDLAMFGVTVPKLDGVQVSSKAQIVLHLRLARRTTTVTIPRDITAGSSSIPALTTPTTPAATTPGSRPAATAPPATGPR